MIAFAAALDHTLSFKALGDLGPERPVMLIGPSGAGKTVTAAKLCACARLAEARSLLITLDAGKAGGRAQAEPFARARSEERRVGEGGVSTGRARWSPEQ